MSYFQCNSIEAVSVWIRHWCSSMNVCDDNGQCMSPCPCWMRAGSIYPTVNVLQNPLIIVVCVMDLSNDENNLPSMKEL